MEEEKPKSQRRIHTMEFRVTPEEREIIEQKAKDIGCKFSHYARLMLMHGQVFNISAEEKIQLRGIGININQIAKKLNSGEANADFLEQVQEFFSNVEKFYKPNADRKNSEK